MSMRSSKAARLEARAGSNIAESIGESLMVVPVAMIEADPGQPRKAFPAESIAVLARSMKAEGPGGRRRGVLKPLLVRRVAAERYALIDGERRLRAAREAGLGEVPCRIVGFPEEPTAGDLAALRADQLAANLHEDLEPLEKARAYAELIRDHGWSQERVGEHVGLTQGAVSKVLALLDLPAPVQALVEAEQLPPSTAREIASRVEDPKAQIALARQAAKEGLTREQVIDRAGGNIPRECPHGQAAGSATSAAAPASALGASADTKPGAAAEGTAAGKGRAGRAILRGWDVPEGTVSVELAPGTPRGGAAAALRAALAVCLAEDSGAAERFPLYCRVRVDDRASVMHGREGEVIEYPADGRVKVKLKQGEGTVDWTLDEKALRRVSVPKPRKGAFA